MTQARWSWGRTWVLALATVLAWATVLAGAGCRPPEVTAATGRAASPDSGGVGAGARRDGRAFRVTRTLEANGVRVEAVIDRPANDDVDVLLLFHGTVGLDARILQAAQDTLDRFRAILERDDLLLVSVAYPEEGLLMGDNVAYAEAALAWVRQRAAEALGVRVGRVFLAGHSQGGYVATRLNALHAVDAVVANAPGPLDLVFRCGLEEQGKAPAGAVCADLAAKHGSTTANPQAYAARSLLAFASGQRSNVLFVQGLDDTPIQLRSWPLFRQRVEQCTDCQGRTFLEVPGVGHQALFVDQRARRAFNDLLRRR